MTSFENVDETSRASTDSNSKENINHDLKSRNKLAKMQNDDQNTSFNPFGRYRVVVESHRKMFEEAAEKLIKSLKTDSTDTNFKQKPETKQMIVDFKKVMGIIRQMAKSNASAIPCTLSCFVKPLNALCDEFEKNLSNVKSGEIMQICQFIADLVNLISQYTNDSCGAELLEEWAPLLERLLASNLSILRNCGVNLWKRSFGNVKGRLRYPAGNLHSILTGLPKKHNLVIPPKEHVEINNINDAVFHSDDDEVAMDGLMDEKIAEKPAKVVETNSQESITFELSQQPNVDNLAQKLIEEKTKQVEKSPARKSARSRKGVNSEKLLLDEDSRDFVVIKTPTSLKKKAQLTDRQKEKFEESREGINYVNEESQSGVQKEAALKNALTTFNFDIEESQSAKPKPEPEVTIQNECAARNSTKRPRRLFNSDSDTEKTTPKKRSKKIELSEECLAANNNDDDKDVELIALPKVEDSEKKVEDKKEESQKVVDDVEKIAEPEPEPAIPRTPSTRAIPKTATTPSILRKPPVEGTPATERKRRNRVHFDANGGDSERKVAEVAVVVEEASSSLPGIDYDADMVPLYPALRDCDESVEVLARRLVPLSGAVSCMSILKKSLAQAGIKTIGQFAMLTVKQVAKMNGIRPVREKTARKVLAEYEANAKRMQKMAEKSAEDASPELMEIAENEPEKQTIEQEVVPSPIKTVEAQATPTKENIADMVEQKSPEKVEQIIVEEVEEKLEKKEDTVEKPENEILKDAQLLDEISRRIARNLARNGIESAGDAQLVDDTLFDSFIRLRGLVRERGFKNA